MYWSRSLSNSSFVAGFCSLSWTTRKPSSVRIGSVVTSPVFAPVPNAKLVTACEASPEMAGMGSPPRLNALDVLSCGRSGSVSAV